MPSVHMNVGPDTFGSHQALWAGGEYRLRQSLSKLTQILMRMTCVKF